MRYLLLFTAALSNLGAMLRIESVVHTSGGSMSYCSECLKKFLPWRIPDTAVFSSWFDDFHRDLYELMECSNRCTLCQYICEAFGNVHLEEFLARVTEHNSKPEEVVEPGAAEEMVYYKDGYRSLLSLSRAPKGAPTVSVRYYAQDSCVDSQGYVDHVVVVVILQHHVSEVWHDRKSFIVYTEAGMLAIP